MDKNKLIPFEYIGTKVNWWDDKVKVGDKVYYLQDLSELPYEVFKKAKKEKKVKEVKEIKNVS